MMDSYLLGSITQLIERARVLRTKIPRNLPRDYDALAQTCVGELQGILDRLRSLLTAPMIAPNCRPERLRLFRRAVSDLDILENTGIAALERAGPDDHRLNELMDRIRREINYPLVAPVVTCLSQEYFRIFTDLKLLCVPLSEGRFLLHLPDLYHELGHPLLVERDDPLVEPFQESHASALGDVLTYLAEETEKQEWRSGPETFTVMLGCWEASWVRNWLVEFFCDLFAVYALGPAFAWAHLHLCAKRGGEPFDVPMFRATSHPADDARMRAMLMGLSMIGFPTDAGHIRDAWRALMERFGARPQAEYIRCYPDRILSAIARQALSGVRGMNCRIAQPDTRDGIHKVLNDAWTQFWQRPAEYAEWERDAVERLMSVGSGKTK